MLPYRQNLKPMSFERVKPPHNTSAFPWFRLPTELVDEVSPHIPRADLSSLALVDKSCCQLARSIQYLTVRMDYTDRALALLEALHNEAVQPNRISGILPCIRRIVVSTDKEYVQEREGAYLDDLIFLSAEDIQARVRKSAEDEYLYISRICAIIQKSPNLMVLDWQDPAAPCATALRCFFTSHVKHIRFNNVQFDEDTAPRDVTDWSLESLDIATPQPCSGQTFLQDILPRSAPTLTHLKWTGHLASTASPSALPSFPLLRSLEIVGVCASDPTILPTLLGPSSRIHSLTIDEASAHASDFFSTRGSMSSLRSLTWNCAPSVMDDPAYEFLVANSHLHSFSANSPLDPTFVADTVLPLLCGQFSGLQSLHLTWDTTVIPDEALSTLSNIVTLRHLWISAGTQMGCRHNWRIDHQSMMTLLKPLVRLETLGYSRDTYKIDSHPLVDPSVETYYTTRPLPQNVSFAKYLSEDQLSLGFRFPHLKPKQLSQAWEGWHMETMKGIVTGYTSVFNQLKWCFTGQIPFRVEIRYVDGCAKKFVVEERDSRDPELFSLVEKWKRN